MIDWPDLDFGPINLWTAPSQGVVQVLEEVRTIPVTEERVAVHPEVERLLSMRKNK